MAENYSLKQVATFSTILLTLVLLAARPAKVVAADDFDSRKSADTLLRQAVELVKAGDLASAVPLLKQSIQLDDSSAAAHNDLGYCLDRLGQRAEARAELEKATTINPRMPDPWATLGQIDVESGDLQGALRAYQSYLDVAGNSPKRQSVEQTMDSIRKQISLGATSGGRDYYQAAISEKGAFIWTPAQMPVKVFIGNGEGVPGFKPDYDAIVRQSFGDWSLLSAGRITFVFVPREDIADIVCRFSDNRSALKSGIEGGETRWKARTTGELTHADIVLLTIDPAPDVHLTHDLMEWITHHEIGHAIGIHGHSGDPQDVMYFSGTPSSYAKRFSNRDQNTLARLYRF